MIRSDQPHQWGVLGYADVYECDCPCCVAENVGDVVPLIGTLKPADFQFLIWEGGAAVFAVNIRTGMCARTAFTQDGDWSPWHRCPIPVHEHLMDAFIQ